MPGSNAGPGSVVVPAVRAPHSTTVLRSLGRRGVHTVAVSEHESPPAFWSRHCNERVRVPAPSEDAAGYRDALLDLARREDVEAIVPLREADVFTLVHNGDAFAEHVAPLWPSVEALTAVHDRVRLFDAADRAGVAVPETQLLTEVDDWDRERIVKGRYAVLADEYVDVDGRESAIDDGRTSDSTGARGAGGSNDAAADGGAAMDGGVGVQEGGVSNASSVDVPANRLTMPEKTTFLDPGEEPPVDAIVDAMGHVPIAQSYVDGTEYCLRAFYHDGEPVATSQKRLVRGYKYSRGPSVYHEAVDVPELEAAGLALLDELDWHGMASVGFIRDDDGAFNLLEVNPRLPASVPVDVHAGVDYPWYRWQLATRGEVGDGPTYRPGRASHLVRGELVHLHSVLSETNPLVERPSIPGTLGEMAWSVGAHPRFDLLSATDPGPFLKNVVDSATSLLRGD